MRTAAFLLGWLITATALHAGALADLGVFSLDVVALLDRDEEVSGDAAHAVEHRQFTYLFATPESKAAFEADPDRYAVRQGGACPRMGALSGVGRPDLWAVHDGSLYFCASEGCRATFNAEPHLLLEVDDPAPVGGDAARGAELATRLVDWMGGAAAINGIHSVQFAQRRQVESGGVVYDNESVMLLHLPNRVWSRTRWDERTWDYAIDGQSGYFADSDGNVRLMDADQRAEAARRRDRTLLVLLHCFLAGDCVASAMGPDAAIAGERLALRHGGVTVELVVDSATGEALAQRQQGWGGSRAVVGTVERRYTHWREVGGVRFPVGWKTWFNGERFERGDRVDDGEEIALNTPVDMAKFAPPLE